ncbi:restriction endonuclease subunit S [Flavobacterium sp. W1B]|uniref:restriction endonuclease subunit S n=1 Tax=Flavobacterium sp. W1B TaxID=3394146 RepID=UPI0039BC8A64
MEKLIPKLRFPEFLGEWEEKKLGDVAKFSKGKGVSKSEIFEDGINECIRYGELYTRYGEVIENVISRTNVSLDKSVVSEANDVIIPASGETQIDIATASCVIKSGIILGGDLNIIKTIHDGIFLSFYLNNKRKLDIANLAQGISVVHIYASQLALLKLNFPSLPEQTKIANFLTEVDKKLAALKQKKSLLEQYKKGIMQQIFSQELRFKDDNGNDFPDWEEKKLKEVCKINPKSDILPSSFIYIDLESVVAGQLLKETTIQLREAPSRAQRLLITEDILFQMVRPYQKNNLYFDKKGKYVASTGYAQIRARESSRFLYQIIHTNDFVNKVLDRCTGTSYPAINSTDLANISILIPSLQEQTKIASFLSAIDEKINHCQGQIEKTEVWKKGLLQQLFV